jgi:hypothetical protein
MFHAGSQGGRIEMGAPMRRVLMICVLLVAAAIVPACSSSKASVQPLYLFSIESDGGHVVNDESTGTARQVLVLPVEDVVTWFTDRPVREAGNLTMTEFIQDWVANGFAADPPDASLILTTPDGVQRSHIVELLGVEETESGVYFELIDLFDSDDTEAAGDTATHRVETGEMEFIEIFIESSSTCARCESQSR